MKRMSIIIVIFCLSVTTALAEEIDLSQMSYPELCTLRKQIDDAIKNTPECQEIIIQNGTWKIGEDIPEGYWTITLAKGEYVTIIYEDSVFDLTWKATGFEGIYEDNINLRLTSGGTITVQNKFSSDEDISLIFSPFAGAKGFFSPVPIYVETIYDLANLSYTELVDLQCKVNDAIWDSAEWEYTLLDMGTYQIGLDIPSGDWNIIAVDIGIVGVFYHDQPLQLDELTLDMVVAVLSNKPDEVFLESTSEEFFHIIGDSVTINLKDGYYLTFYSPRELVKQKIALYH